MNSKMMNKGLVALHTAAATNPTYAFMQELVLELLNNIGKAEYNGRNYFDGKDLPQLYQGEPNAESYVAKSMHGHSYGWIARWAKTTEGYAGGYKGGYTSKLSDVLALNDFLVRYYKIAEIFISFWVSYEWREQ